jgi:hypothetical protein
MNRHVSTPGAGHLVHGAYQKFEGFVAPLVGKGHVHPEETAMITQLKPGKELHAGEKLPFRQSGVNRPVDSRKSVPGGKFRQLLRILIEYVAYGYLRLRLHF